MQCKRGIDIYIPQIEPKRDDIRTLWWENGIHPPLPPDCREREAARLQRYAVAWMFDGDGAREYVWRTWWLGHVGFGSRGGDIT